MVQTNTDSLTGNAELDFLLSLPYEDLPPAKDNLDRALRDALKKRIDELLQQQMEEIPAETMFPEVSERIWNGIWSRFNTHEDDPEPITWIRFTQEQIQQLGNLLFPRQPSLASALGGNRNVVAIQPHQTPSIEESIDKIVGEASTWQIVGFKTSPQKSQCKIILHSNQPLTAENLPAVEVWNGEQPVKIEKLEPVPVMDKCWSLILTLCPAQDTPLALGLRDDADDKLFLQLTPDKNLKNF